MTNGPASHAGPGHEQNGTQEIASVYADAWRSASQITISITPASDGAYDARLGEAVVCRSPTPFCLAARKLLGIGHPSSTILVMVSAGSTVERLRAPLGVAAGLTADRNPSRE